MHKSKGFFMGDSEFLYVLASKWGGGEYPLHQEKP